MNPKLAVFPKVRTALACLLLATSSTGVCGPDATLDAVALDINGERVLVRNSETVEVIRGDLMTLIDAWTTDKSLKIDAIDVVGFASKRSPTLRDDRLKVINTATELQGKYGVGENRSIFLVQSKIADKTVGEIRIKLVEPRLDRVEIVINGKQRLVRDGDSIDLKATDTIAVRHVVTNVRGNENVHHELKTTSKGKNKTDKELVFARGTQVFGRIGVRWQE